MIYLDVFAVGESVGRGSVLKPMPATRRAILEKKSNTHVLTMPTRTANDSYLIVLSASV